MRIGGTAEILDSERPSAKVISVPIEIVEVAVAEGDTRLCN